MRPHTRVLSFFIALACVGAHAVTYVVPPDEALIARTDAIVIARALHSHVEESAARGIETVTVLAVEEVLVGDASLAGGIRVRTSGGTIETKDGGKRAMVVPGAPRFADGERVLLFARRVGAGDYATTDLGLGLFGFATDELGHRVLVRAESEIVGWDPDGSVHHEPRRDADRFLAFIRDVVNRRPAVKDYIIKALPLEGESRSIEKTRQRPLSVFTATQYTFVSSGALENTMGFRWKAFPAAVNWNRGNAQPNDGNNGNDAINTAFGAWNGDASSNVNYVLATANANANGLFEATDSVNNIVFEKDMTAHGISAFNCVNGGVLGAGGVHIGVSDATNTVNGEVFFRNVEADVSMNQGIGACLPGGTGMVAPGDFHTSVTHELGHTLGFRHADKSRDNSLACTSFANYDCSDSAIMTHFVVVGLGGALTPWDQRAVEALYPSPAAPSNLVATAASSTSVALTWTAVAGAASYTVYRTPDNATYSNVGTPATNSFTDSSASANTAYLYKVTATGSGVESGDSNKDLATTVIFTDPILAAQSTQIKAAHVTELRAAVNAVRKLANGGFANDFSYSDPAITAQSTQVSRIHVIDLRNALDPARAALGLAALSYTDTTITAQTTLVKAVHFAELRGGVQ
ncbi:MAG TPA: hypothetical protein VEZ11_19070 [Thermoanaerobaculia bacterium]|nr:hypothetical protein [Thermoanaerobaculia bacterium]